MDFVDQLKSQLDIVDVVGHYVRLKRNGGEILAGFEDFNWSATTVLHAGAPEKKLRLNYGRAAS